MVTGGTGGIGYQTARMLARGGARLIITGRSADTGETAAATIPASGGNVGGDRRDDPWVGLLELAPGSQYRVPCDDALFGRHRVWVAIPNQCGRSDSR